MLRPKIQHLDIRMIRDDSLSERIALLIWLFRSFIDLYDPFRTITMILIIQ